MFNLASGGLDSRAAAAEITAAAKLADRFWEQREKEQERRRRRPPSFPLVSPMPTLLFG